MKISLEWLKDYVALPDSADALAGALTNGGTEVVGREGRGQVPEKVVVAQILSSERHPNADRLSVCQVDDGSGQPRQIVCGAKNYQVGDKVPLALPGAVLGPDFKIKSGKLRGVTSDGMMCSAKELALAEDAEGLLILSADAPVGRPVKELFPPDTVLELEVTPNRPDLLGYRGVAREVAALTQVEANLTPPPMVPEKAAGEAVKLDDEGCPFYTARIIRGVKVGPSPQWLADRLTAVGLRPINNVVDVTNYVLMETGQPLHAFDLAKLGGGILVRAAREGETLKALDGSELKLRTHDLVIADAGKAVALAGVMGGEESGVTGGTTDLLLESAWFEPARVRRSSRELGISTDSSYRFERRVDPAGVAAASARAVQLILQAAGGSAESELLVAGSRPAAGTDVALDQQRCRALLGLDIADEEIDAILTRLGLIKSGVPEPARGGCGRGVTGADMRQKVGRDVLGAPLEVRGGSRGPVLPEKREPHNTSRQSGERWRVPSFRPDLTREVDLIEEVIRIAGIERVPSRLRGFPAGAGVADLRHDNAEKLRERLRAQGFSEARTSHFVAPETLQRAGAEVSDAVAIRNPLGAEQALLRPVLLSGLLEALARNIRHGADAVRLFEIGPVFRAGGIEEQTALALVATGGGSDFHEVKGVVAAALGGVDFVPGGGLALRVTGSGVEGSIRRLPHALAEAHAAKQPVHYAEILVDGWLGAAPPAVRVRALPKFPSAERDLSLVVPHAVSYAAIEKTLLGARAPHLQSVGLKDVFTDPSGAKLAVDQRSVTVTLTFRDEARTLTSDEIDRAVETLRDHAKAELGAVFRA